MEGLTERVADAIVGWARIRARSMRDVPMLPLRLDLRDRALAEVVRAKLAALSGPDAWFEVRQSWDDDVVLLRNGRPEKAPPGVTGETPLLYLIFWLPGERGHELNSQSLADVPAISIGRLLADRESFAFPEEHAIEARCRDAGTAWPLKHQAEAAVALVNAWKAVRGAIRTGKAGRGGAIAFVERLDDYALYLERAFIDDVAWAAIRVEERPARLVSAWGEALSMLGMFKMPALASVVGIEVRTDRKPGRSRVQENWESALLRIFAENREAEMDHASLADSIAGKLSVEKQVAALAGRGIRLSSTDPVGGQEALLSFCRTGDPSARERIEWLFFEKPDERRSAWHGLRGLLAARNVRRTRTDPVERAVAETQELLVAAAGDGRTESIVSYVQHLRPSGDEPERAQVAAAALRAIAEGQLPAEPAATGAERDALQAVLGSTALDASRLQRAIALWDALAAAARRPGAEAVAPTLLLGLARLCSSRLSVGDQGSCFPDGRRPILGEQLVVRYLARRGTDPLEFACSVDEWSDATLANIGRWLREKVVPAYQGEDDDDSEEGAEQDAEAELVFEVARRQGTKTEALGTIEIDVDAEAVGVVGRTAEYLASWAEELSTGVDGARRRVATLFAGNPQVETPAGLADGWNKWTASLKKANTGWSLASLIAPIDHAAVAWVDAWASQLERFRSGAGAAGAEGKRRELEQERDAAIMRGDLQAATKFLRDLSQLTAAAGGAELPQIESVRSVLRTCTGRRSRDERVEQVVLLPHHPLVLRLRRLADVVLRDVLKQIWTEGWPEEGLEHLREALDDWGLPEPLHFYGFWDDDPLVFEGWIGDGWLASFGRLASTRSSQSVGPGVGEVARTVDRYLRLYRAAGDRLNLRFHGDRDGKWALAAIQALIDARKAAFRADVTVIGSPADLEDQVLETQLSAEERARAFEMGDDGATPRVRVRAQEKSTEQPVHLNVVLGDAVPEFRPQAERQAAPAADRKIWDVGVLFAEAIPRPDMNAFIVEDPRDELSLLAAAAVGYARNGQLAVHVERYSFDETRVGPPLKRLHADAHWLVLVSRQPLHRAVQAVGERVASLLDFRVITEKNRPVHASVSVGVGQFQSDLTRLEGMLRALLGTSVPGLATALVRAARRFVPGVAINAIGGTNAAQLEGLLGLILTQRQIAASDHLVLSVDQHQELLSRRAGPIGDVLILRRATDGIHASVAESKFTRGPVDAQSPVAATAVKQVKATVEKLIHLSAVHPLAFVPRHMLARTIASQIQLAADPAVTGRLQPFLAQALDQQQPLKVEPTSACAVHIWSTSEASVDGLTRDAEVPVHVHSRNTTLSELRELALAQ